MPLSIANRDIIKKSLVYYSNKVVNFSRVDGLPDIAKKDLMAEYGAIEKAKNELESPPKQPAENSYSHRLDNREYSRVICSALKCYLSDLEKSMAKISELYEGAKIPFSLTNTDLQLVKEALTKIPECD